MIRRLLLLNGVAILCVIFFHSVGWGFVAMFSWAHRYLPVAEATYAQQGSLSYYGLRVIEQVVVFAIPAFLFVSGLFIAIATGRKQSTIGWRVVGMRLRDLLIPYLLWSLLLFVLFAAEGTTFRPVQYLEMLLTGRTNPAYYYVPLLVQFYLLAPLLVPLAKRWWAPLLVVTGLIQLGVQLLYYPALLGLDGSTFQSFVDLLPKWFFPTRIFWFSAGIVAGFHLQQLEQLLTRYRWWLLGVTLLLLPLGVIEWEAMLRYSGQPWIDHRETLIDTLYSATLILSFLAFARFSPPVSRTLEELGSKSFGIYIIHSPVMELTARAVYHVLPALLGYQLLFQPLIIVMGLGVPLLLMSTFQRSPLRPYYKLSFG